MQTDWVYLIHFAQPISPDHTCQHYLGSAENPFSRLHDHLTGKGARLTQVANERGIEYRIVRVWKAEPGKGRELERKLKRRKEGPKLCPICAEKRKCKQPQHQPPLLDPLDFTLNDLGEIEF